jgi:transcriptional regulator with XRE-family HTH domain
MQLTLFDLPNNNTPGQQQNLRDWLINHNLSHQDFADKIDCSRSRLAVIITGRVIPGKNLAKRISDATNNEIPIERIRDGSALGYPGQRKRVKRKIVHDDHILRLL